MRTETGVLDLSQATQVANGAVRDVFERPGHPDQLLKTLRLEKRAVYDSRPGLLAQFKRRFTLGPYKYFLKEYRCYLRTAHLAEKFDRPIPIAEFGGVVRTERGLAQVVQKVGDEQGGLAPTLRMLLRVERFDPDLLRRLNAFVDDIHVLRVVAPDLNAGNIVLDPSGDAPRFVLIDGYGEKSVLPLRAWFPALNARQLDRNFARIGRSRHLIWNAAARRFDPAPDQ
ncbi:PhoP regulatory network YrbL family protein [Jannaschia sp. S6380]|uniref:YrbL family protein n=1 Tax=Jannaschia sp. S6380 TaxID=2926408 RepID=UPI001FF1CCBD|nr:YrbL family protein [Jannaschia sp. S6380]MCK0166467.1 PhoP regulatory network YrbL family protein [Jannaschia sp. S6380]